MNSGVNALFLSALQSFLYWAESIKFLVLAPIYLRSILIFTSHLRLRLPRSLFPVVSIIILKLLQSSLILIICPFHLNTLELIGTDYRGSAFLSLFHSPFVSFQDKYIYLKNPYLHSSLNVRDLVSQPYSTTGSITVLYISIFKFLERSLEEKECLDWIITWISCFKSTFYFLLNRIK